jgi:hypothetical protein
MWYAVLLKLEKLAKSDKFIASLLADLQWPRMQWVRMILVGLFEAEFKVVPAWIFRRVLSAWRGITFTKPTEDMNRILRNLEKTLNLNGQAGRQARWHSLVTSKVPFYGLLWEHTC